MLVIGKPVTYRLLEKEKVYKCKMGNKFMVILPGVSVVVKFQSRFGVGGGCLGGGVGGEKEKTHYLMLASTQTLAVSILSEILIWVWKQSLLIFTYVEINVLPKQILSP